MTQEVGSNQISPPTSTPHLQLASMRVGFILLDKKKPRVLTPALSAAAVQHGFQLVALDPSTPAQWEEEKVDVIVHKVPEDSDLDAKLLQYQQHHPATVLLDPPAAVRAVQDRELMLAPLIHTSLVFKSTAQHQQQQQLDQQQTQEQLVVISTPAQVTLPAQCSLAEAQQLLTTAGVTWPALIKPLLSAPPDSATADIAAPSRVSSMCQASPAVATSHSSSSRDGHTLGAVLSAAGLHELVSGDCDPALSLPVVLQQFVPHGPALYKLYVIGPHVILTRRSTLTMQLIEEQAAAAAASQSESRAAGVVLLNRVSAVPLQPPSQEVTLTHSDAVDARPADRPHAAHTHATEHHGQQREQQQQKQEHLDMACDFVGASNRLQACPTTHARPLSGTQQQQQLSCLDSSVSDTLGNSSLAATAATAYTCSSGVALCDSSVEGDAAAPPLWAMKQLATYMRQQLGLNLFNIDIIAPETFDDTKQQLASGQSQQDEGEHVDRARSGLNRQYLVVDVNFFPGFDKVPGAEQLFAQYLVSLTQCD